MREGPVEPVTVAASRSRPLNGEQRVGAYTDFQQHHGLRILGAEE